MYGVNYVRSFSSSRSVKEKEILQADDMHIIYLIRLLLKRGRITELWRRLFSIFLVSASFADRSIVLKAKLCASMYFNSRSWSFSYAVTTCLTSLLSVLEVFSNGGIRAGSGRFWHPMICIFLRFDLFKLQQSY